MRWTIALVIAIAHSHDCAHLPLGTEFRWLHPPKTGTSFSATILYYLCPSLDPDAATTVIKGSVMPADTTRPPFRPCCGGLGCERNGTAARIDDKLSYFLHTPLVFAPASASSLAAPWRTRRKASRTASLVAPPAPALLESSALDDSLLDGASRPNSAQSR